MDLKETLKQIKQLVKRGEYENALQLTLALRKEYPTDKNLHKLINKIKVKMRKLELGGRGAFIKRGLKMIRHLRKEKEYEKAIQACNELLEVDPENKKVLKLRRKLSTAFIEQKLHDPLKKQWEEQKEYEKLYIFYHKLKKIFPHYTKLNRLIFETEKKMLEEDRIKKAAFSEDSLKKLREMYAEGKYEDVIEGCEDLIIFTHEGSTDAKKLLEITKKDNLKEIERDTFEHIKNQIPLLKEAYKSKSEPMIKI